jgi:hypothetical protein
MRQMNSTTICDRLRAPSSDLPRLLIAQGSA